MEKRKNEWNKESFLVYDRSLRYPSAPFFEWLHSEGFKMGWNLYPYGHTGCGWVYVNITKRKIQGNRTKESRKFVKNNA